MDWKAAYDAEVVRHAKEVAKLKARISELERNMPKTYRIRHKPTGLFYKPGCPNLSKKGKKYLRKPSVDGITIRLADSVMDYVQGLAYKEMSGIRWLITEPDDFEIVES